jgi:hypothetical protein
MKNRIKRIQREVGVSDDGIIGPQTLDALERALGISRVPEWPTQANVRAGNSIFGKPGDESALVSIKPAYQLYFEGTPVKTIRVHRLIADHVAAALKEVLEHYGPTRIKELSLDQYGGSYNYRSTATGRSLSMHAWGVALDFAPGLNAYEKRKPYASLSRPECDAWWEIWERHGAVSLGRERDYDWMHLQFAKL